MAPRVLHNDEEFSSDADRAVSCLEIQIIALEGKVPFWRPNTAKYDDKSWHPSDWLTWYEMRGGASRIFPEVETKTDALEAEMPSDAEGEDADMTGPAFDAIIHKGWKVSYKKHENTELVFPQDIYPKLNRKTSVFSAMVDKLPEGRRHRTEQEIFDASNRRALNKMRTRKSNGVFPRTFRGRLREG